MRLVSGHGLDSGARGVGPDLGDGMIGLMAALVLYAQGVTEATTTPATTTTPPPPAAVERAKVATRPKGDPNAVVCHEEALVGSRFTHKVCQSPRGAAMRAQDDRESIRHVQDMTPAPTLH